MSEKGPGLAAAAGLRRLWGGGVPGPVLLPQAGAGAGRGVPGGAGAAGGGPVVFTKVVNDPMKVVVVKSPRILAGILRFLFKIRKEETE